MDSKGQPTDTVRLPGSGPGDAAPRPVGAAGMVLAGKYQLLSEIGRGGMGSVWKAERLGWKALVAVKLMSLPDDARARERFEREVRLAAALRSPHVVQVLDHGIDEGSGNPFIAMELLEGESLAARLRRLGALSPGEVMTIISHLSRALTRAHDAGIVHRDLKPDNIYWVSNGDEPVIKILDFGVAKWFEVSKLDGRPLTGQGRTVGTPFYMSPEQFRGTGPIDHRLDLWSLAVIACECITGQRPFDAKDFASLAVLLCGDGQRPIPSVLGRVPAGFDDWFSKATARDITRRFQSAQELADTLRPVCGASGGNIPPVINQLESSEPEVASMAPLSHTSERPSFLARRPRLTTALVAVTVVGITSNILILRHWSLSRGAPPLAITTGSKEVPAERTNAEPVVEPHSTVAAPVPFDTSLEPTPLPEPPTLPGKGTGSVEPAANGVEPRPAEVLATPSAKEAKRPRGPRHLETRQREMPQPAQPKSDNQGTINGNRIIRTEL